MYACVCVCLSGGVAVRPPDVILQNWIFRCTALLFRQLFASSSLQWFWIVDIGSVHDQMERPSRRHTYVYLYKLILILYTCVWVRCHTAKLRYQLYLMFSNFLIYPSCYFRFAFVCVDQPQTQTVVHTHAHTPTVATENKHFQRNKKHRKNDKHWNEILRFLQQATTCVHCVSV